MHARRRRPSSESWNVQRAPPAPRTAQTSRRRFTYPPTNTLHHAMTCCAVLCSAPLCDTMLCVAMLHDEKLHCAFHRWSYTLRTSQIRGASPSQWRIFRLRLNFPVGAGKGTSLPFEKTAGFQASGTCACITGRLR
ncbi:unnamed protein product [Prorocentrum cordatum]|uniref:Uncharacterized protein n=1 Tax=Prorocentrum cordatum TaxID=2364126 RepID=A0ABN9UZC7_9DINO|nr:unnamed protein product [Polarella glacialis]